MMLPRTRQRMQTRESAARLRALRARTIAQTRILPASPVIFADIPIPMSPHYYSPILRRRSFS
jgi:hypothetical protein